MHHFVQYLCIYFVSFYVFYITHYLVFALLSCFALLQNLVKYR